MNLIGKIFIVLIAVMSIFFMGLAVSVYATHQNWKELHTKTNAKFTQMRDDNDQLAAQIEQLKRTNSFERAARTKAIATLETRAQEIQQKYQDAVARLSSLQEEQNTAIESVSLAQSQLEQLKGQNTTLRDSIVKAQADRDEQFSQVRQLTDLINQAEGTKASLERRLQKLTDQYASAQEVLKAYDLKIDTPVHNIPPQLEGIVKAASQDLIEISLGSDDGLRTGHTVEVSRRDRYLGRAKIVKVQSDRSVGQLLSEYRKAPIQEGDSVQTKIR